MTADNRAHALAEQLAAVALVWIGHATCEQVMYSFEPIIAAALADAEARGRQQAAAIVAAVEAFQAAEVELVNATMEDDDDRFLAAQHRWQAAKARLLEVDCG